MHVMSYEINEEILNEDRSEYLFLIDSSALLNFFKVDREIGLPILGLIEYSQYTNFYITNEVFLEMSQKEGILNLELFGQHIINSEFSFAPEYKENKFLVEENGELRYIILNKISGTDYGQIHFCQQHKKINLVSNDRKLIKSAKSVIGEKRAGGPADLVKLLMKLHPEVKLLEKYYEKIIKRDSIVSMTDRWHYTAG